MLKQAHITFKDIISKKDLSFLVFMISMFLLPLSINLSTFSFITAVTLKVIQVLLKRNTLFESKALKNSAAIGLLFFTYILINSILQTDAHYTFLRLEKDYMHFTLFFLTPMLLRNKRENRLLIYAFFLGIICAVIYVLTYAIFNNITYNKDAFISVLDIHHTYLGMYLLAFVNYCLIYLITKKTKIPNHLMIILVLVILMSLGVMYLMDSKVSMLIFLFLFLIHSLPELSKKNINVYVVVLVLILGVFTAFNNKVTVNYIRALDFRIQVWEVSFKVFEDNSIFGNLTMPEKDILNYNHFINGKYYYVDSDLNSHNQYLSILMKFGFVGFIILFLYGINVFRKINPKTEKHDLREFFGFMSIVLTVCYIENVLDRHHGIVYVTFFYNYYLVAIANAEN